MCFFAQHYPAVLTTGPRGLFVIVVDGGFVCVDIISSENGAV